MHEPTTPHTWKARLGVAIAMLAIAFVGVVITDLYQGGGFDYWKWAVAIYALLALWLSYYVKKQKEAFQPMMLLREALHWGALIGTIFLVSYLASTGVMSRFVGGIMHLILTSLAVFLAGVYIEPTFLIIGVCLAIFAVLTAVLVEYMYAIAIPMIIAAVLLVVIWVWISHKKSSKSSH